MPSGETVGRVLSMTYRQKDRSVYYLEKGTKLSLRRWNAQRHLSSGVLSVELVWSRYAQTSMDRRG